MSEPRTVTLTYEVHPLPKTKVEVFDWEAIFARLKAGEEPIYECKVKDARSFYMWANRHKRSNVYYRTVAPGLMLFSLKKQRGDE